MRWQRPRRHETAFSDERGESAGDINRNNLLGTKINQKQTERTNKHKRKCFVLQHDSYYAFPVNSLQIK
uniref:Uncharacterized protein n=1 Tax=Anguilla anguilla TaxID=7936 RepID=A0A0E9U3N7_ANGAN